MPDQAAVAEFDSAAYWRERYHAGGNSGAGAYGRLAVYKAHVFNTVVEARKVRSVVEFGSGDGAQASLFHVREYLGVDLAPAALDLARARLADRPHWRLSTLEEYEAAPVTADMALSLDVIYHLIEDAVFDAYMRRLFAAARKVVLIYSSDHDAPTTAAHVRHRRYSDWIAREAAGWTPAKTWRQPFPFRPGSNPKTTSFAFFRSFQRKRDEPPAGP